MMQFELDTEIAEIIDGKSLSKSQWEFVMNTYPNRACIGHQQTFSGLQYEENIESESHLISKLAE